MINKRLFTNININKALAIGFVVGGFVLGGYYINNDLKKDPKFFDKFDKKEIKNEIMQQLVKSLICAGIGGLFYFSDVMENKRRQESENNQKIH